jgi:hypothetical protein
MIAPDVLFRLPLELDEPCNPGQGPNELVAPDAFRVLRICELCLPLH